MPQGLFESKHNSPDFEELYPDIFENSKVVKVEPHNNLTLSLWFKSNPKEERVFDFKPLIQQHQFYKPLENVDLFMSAHSEASTVVWNDQLDISPEWLYLDSDPVVNV